MKLTFKEVGQGDTILIEWKEKNQRKIGLIDCNLKDSFFNPALEYLKNSDYKSIEFILLTHPHYDHFSGINNILEYCRNNKIIINLFLHTSFSTPEFLQSAVRGHVAKKSLEILFKNVEKFYKNELIIECFYVHNNSREYSFNNKWKMKFLSPSHKEFSEYNRNMYKNNFEISQNNSKANLLSTVIVIYSTTDQIILTSDAINPVFKKLSKAKHKEPDLNLILGQISHHGSIDNFDKIFWKLQKHSVNTPAIISVGENSYGHPSNEVINNMKDINFEVYLTNDTSRLHSSTSQSISMSLDSISTLVNTVTPTIISKDIVFDADTRNIS